MSKKIAILTSGGDCAGLNAAIRGVLLSATKKGWSVIGIREGTHGLIEDPLNVEELNVNDFDGTVMRMGGTVLGTTNKGNPFAFPQADGSKIDLSEKIIAGFKKLDVDGVIGIGGDGSFAILNRIAKQGNLKFVGIPKTIDNDVGETEVSIGFDTAVSVATEALDRLQPTAASHARVMVLEVMGRDAGHIALNAGIAGGADVVLIPEIPYSIDMVAKKIREVKESGRNFALVVVSEAVKTIEGSNLQVEFADGQKRFGGVGQYIGHMIHEKTGAETRVTVLGHVQRGGQPTHQDRIIASAFGVHAVELIEQGKFGRMVGWSKRGVVDVPIEQAIESYKAVDLNDPLVKTARALGICLGDQID